MIKLEGNNPQGRSESYLIIVPCLHKIVVYMQLISEHIYMCPFSSPFPFLVLSLRVLQLHLFESARTFAKIRFYAVLEKKIQTVLSICYQSLFTRYC